MIASRRTRAILFLSTAVAFALFGASCRLVGSGALHVANDESGLGADNTTFSAYAPDAGDAFPPQGHLALFVRGDDFGQPPAYGMNGYLYLVGSSKPCPESEGRPETFRLSDVAIRGIVTVTDGSVNQFLMVADNPTLMTPRWALIEINELAGFAGEHLVHRCGHVTWTTGVTALEDPCTLRTSLGGHALSKGLSFALGQTRWQMCNGGAAAGSNEKLLFRSDDRGASWVLISRTTLGSPPAESGVGELPNGSGAVALYFQSADRGWLGLNSAGHNLLRSTDGGHNWQEVVVSGLGQGVPVQSISFSSSDSGAITTPEGTWVTTNGGASWAKQ
jgi:hypothetical protein